MCEDSILGTKAWHLQRYQAERGGGDDGGDDTGAGVTLWQTGQMRLSRGARAEEASRHTKPYGQKATGSRSQRTTSTG